MRRKLPMPHPGEILKEEFLDPMGLSIYGLAKAIGISRSRLNDICHGRQGITVSIALRLGRYFDVDPQWFLNMQNKYDLETTREALRDALAEIKPHQKAA